MKVLEKGRTQTGWAGEFRCSGDGNGRGGCGAKLLVEKGDLFITQSFVADETIRRLTFMCPDCGVLTDIDSSNSSDRIKLHWAVWDNVPLKENHKLFSELEGIPTI